MSRIPPLSLTRHEGAPSPRLPQPAGSLAAMPTETRPAVPRLPPTWTAGRVVLTDEASWDGVAVGGSFAGQTASLVDVTGCRLNGAAFTGAEIDRLRLADTVVEDCELSGAVLTRLAAVRVEFRRCRLSGLQAAGAVFKDVRFVDCKLDGANFRMTSWEQSAFDGCPLDGADFGSARLRSVRLNGCDLTGADFTKILVDDVSLHRSTLESLRGADGLRGAVVGTDQVLPLALSVFAALGIRVDDTADPDA